MSTPCVVIVGRPNVGKSSLFNWLVGRRLAIVDPTAGVTRDRMTRVIELEGRTLELIDTGGIGINDVDDLTDEVEEQIQTAISAADVILFMVDGRDGVVALDEQVAQRLRHLNLPVLCVVNKLDHARLKSHANDFYGFGWDVISISVQENIGKEELVNCILESLPPDTHEEKEHPEPVMKVALVGRRNTGKSTFVNYLVNTPRMIVSPVAGTTRDSVDVQFVMDGKPFIAVDTPGFRRRVSVKTNVDYYGTHRAQRSIRYADVTLMFFDCTEPISKVDKQLVGYIAEEYKPCIFVVNKWDLVRTQIKTDAWADYLRDTFPSLWHTPIAFITGKTGKNVKILINHAQMLFRQSLSRISTSRLNRLIRAALVYNQPPLYRTSRPKIYYATQVGVQPPTIVLFCNNPDMFPPPYRRYLLSVLRDQLDFGEVPIKLYFRKREMNDTRDEVDALLETRRASRVSDQVNREAQVKQEMQEWCEAQERYEKRIQEEALRWQQENTDMTDISVKEGEVEEDGELQERFPQERNSIHDAESSTSMDDTVLMRGNVSTAANESNSSLFIDKKSALMMSEKGPGNESFSGDLDLEPCPAVDAPPDDGEDFKLDVESLIRPHGQIVPMDEEDEEDDLQDTDVDLDVRQEND